MSAYRLLVRAAGEVLKQGTAWLLRPDLAVTAFHVVGETTARAWLHERPSAGAEVTYLLLDGPLEVPLEPVACDLRADVAMLRCRAKLSAPSTLSLAKEGPARSMAFRAEGYPAFHGGAPFTISGEIIDVRGDAASTALQLLIREGTQVSWEGISGGALQTGDHAAGVITQVTSGVSTGWAASALAVRRLERILDAGDLRAACRDLLLKLYPAEEHLLDLRADLGWPSLGGEDRAKTAGLLADRAALEGADGLLRLLDEMGNDHPASAEVEPLRTRVLERARSDPRRTAPSRAQQVRGILQELGRPMSAGVAILEPLGFQARAIVDEVFTHLKRPGEALLPVHLVPERCNPSEDRLYSRLLRDLRHALPEPWRGLVDAQKAASARDRFECAMEALLDGPVRDAGRNLLFIIEGLARVPPEQLEEWGFLLARLSNRGLKLLVWGGQELHDLRTQPPADGRFSAFHVLREARIGALGEEEVQRLVAERGGGEAAAAVVYEETGGHPALVAELVERYTEDACAGDRGAVAARIQSGAHLARLRRIVGAEPALHAPLRAFAAAEGRPLGRRHTQEEARLEWLGILKDAGAMHWAWVAPAMRRFAGEWS